MELSHFIPSDIFLLQVIFTPWLNIWLALDMCATRLSEQHRMTGGLLRVSQITKETGDQDVFCCLVMC